MDKGVLSHLKIRKWPLKTLGVGTRKSQIGRIKVIVKAPKRFKKLQEMQNFHNSMKITVKMIVNIKIAMELRIKLTNLPN